MTMPFHSGYVAIAGRPNMGKSTFLNRILGRKLAIVTPKPQTTRTRILGIHHGPNIQMVFLDTPGIHENRQSVLNQAMVRTAFESCREADVILYFVSASHGLTQEDLDILSRLPTSQAALILVMNMMDRVHRLELLPRLSHAGQSGVAFSEVVPISALSGENMDRLLTLIQHYLPEGPPYFSPEQWTDQPERFLAGEIVREKLILFLQQELPYAVAVRVDSFEEKTRKIHIQATILVERTSQKGIVIGQGGSMLKKIGMSARQDMEGFFGMGVDLRLWVNVVEAWSSNLTTLQELGYPSGPDRAMDG